MAMAASLALLLLLGGTRPQPASAASCSVNGIDSFSSGSLTVEGEGACSDHSEAIKVYCGGATVLIDYAFIDTNDLSATKNTGVPCGSVVVVDIEGLIGNDRIEMTPLGSARLANGGAGDDTILIRNGVNDVADCGDGFDSIQADQHKLDSANNCELTDFAPDSPASAAKKKCKKNRKHKCRKHKKKH